MKGLVVAVLALVVPACDREAARPVFPLADEPLPPASERCYRERFEVRGKPFELRLRVRTEPAAGRITRVVTELGANGPATWTTVMTVDSERFTSVERGPEGEAAGEGTLTGPRWAWTTWRAVTQRPDGFAEHAELTFSKDAVVIVAETRGSDGAVASTSTHRYLEAACLTFGDDPIESLDPKAR